MRPELVNQLAETLSTHWTSGRALSSLSPALSPQSRDDGYTVQASLCTQVASEVVGWKIAATSDAGQKHIGVSGPLAGRIFAHTLCQAGTPISLSGNRMRVAEPEMVFTFAHSLPARKSPYKQSEVMAAVGSLSIAIEIPNSRFLDFVTAGEPCLIADNACAHAFLPGPQAPEGWRDLDLSQHAVTACVTSASGQQWHRSGSGAAVLGDPRLALTWIANELSALGVGLKPGEFVTTGTCMVPIAVEPGDRVDVDFGIFGQLSAVFGA